MTDTYTLETLSKMSLEQIMEKMNHQEKVIKMIDEDTWADQETISKLKKQIKTLTAAKPKKIRIKGTKKELLNYLDRTEEELLSVLSNSWSFCDEKTMEGILESYENQEIKLRPKMLKDMRGIVEKVFPKHC